MVARKKRVPAVLDTNVFVRNFKSQNKSSPNRRIIQLWLQENRLQLVVSDDVVSEYLATFTEVVEMEADRLHRWREHFKADDRCTRVNLGPRYWASRDPDDNVFLATARAGNAKYLVTNDRDLLDLPDDFKRMLPFAIVTPREFLDEFEQ